MAIHFCNICCEANLVGPEAQHKWVNVLFSSGPYMQNMCHLNIPVHLVLFHICCKNFCMRVRAGVATAHRPINTAHESLNLLLTTVAYLWPVKMAVKETADDEVLQKTSRIWCTSSGVLGRHHSCHLQQSKSRGLVQRPLLPNQLPVLEPKNITTQEHRTNFMLHLTLNIFKLYVAPHTEYVQTLCCTSHWICSNLMLHLTLNIFKLYVAPHTEYIQTLCCTSHWIYSNHQEKSTIANTQTNNANIEVKTNI